MTNVTNKLREKRKFKYKLSSFEQLFNEIERLESREAILIKYLSRIMKVVENPNWHGDEAKLVVVEILQVMFDEIAQQPDKSYGFNMIEQMGIDFYEQMKKDLCDD